MTMLASDDLYRMRADAQATMMHTCEIGQFAEATDAGGDAGVRSFTWGDETPCGFDLDTSRRRQEIDGSDIAYSEGVIRLPSATEIKVGDRIRITGYPSGVIFPPEEYALVGEPRKGLLQTVCYVRRLHGGGHG